MKISIQKLNLINILATVLVFGAVVAFFVVERTTSNYEKRVMQLEESYTQSNKELVKTEVTRVAARIEYTKQAVYDRLNSSLKDKTEYIAKLLDKNSDTKTAIQKIKKNIEAFKWNNSTGYIYILSSNGDILYHIKPEYVGKNIFDNSQTTDGLRRFLKTAFEKGENFGKYEWPKPNDTATTPKSKYVFIKKYEPLNIYIGAGVYTDEIDKDIQKIILEQLSKERFGFDSYGYFWVHDLNYTMLEHPINKNLIGKNISELKTADGQLLFKNMNDLVTKQGEGFISYSWARPDNGKLDNKISYIYLIKEWGWVIGSGFYLSELSAITAKERETAKETMYAWIEGILVVLTILIFASLLVATYISKRIGRIERDKILYENQLEQYKSILDTTAVVSKTDLRGLITYTNDKFLQVSGYTQNEVIGKPHKIVSHPQTPKEVFKDMWETIQSGNIWHGLIKNKNKNGKSYYNDTTIVPLRNENRQVVEYISSGVDVTELIENKEKLDTAFMTDTLTGLGSRMKLLEALSKDKENILALVDISRFREINDLKGQKFGDALIAESGKRIFGFFSEYGYEMYRIHADVFGILAQKSSFGSFEASIKNFLNSDGKIKYKIQSDTVSVRYNVGIASGHSEVLAWADIALKDAKNHQDSQIAVFTQDAKTLEKYRDNLEWVSRLSKALDEDSVIPYFQPIYNYKNEKIEKYECLMRVKLDGAVYTPDKFLDLAKKTKIYPKLTYKMIEKAIEKFSKTEYEFSINLCIEDLLQKDMMNFLYEYAFEREIMGKIVLEIVESEEMQNYEEVLSTILRFKNGGAKIAIDDFGSGYSNFDYLVSLKADYIKIDGSIVKNITKDERIKEVIVSIVNFAKTYNMKTIAEYVSDEATDKEIRGLGIDYAQGYLYGKPLEELVNP